MMPALPPFLLSVITPFRQVFTYPAWKKVLFLLKGAILCQGTRTITAILSVLGLQHFTRFDIFHRFLSRDKWNMVLGSKILLSLIICIIPPDFLLVICADETLERRKGDKVYGKGCFRDAVQSSHGHVVTAFGLKWIVFTVLVPLPWASRAWALPFFSLLSLSEKVAKKENKKHRTLVESTSLVIGILSHWLKRPFIFLGDGSYACISLIKTAKEKSITIITRPKVNTVLYEHPKTPPPEKRGRKPIKGKRIPSFKEQVEKADEIEKKIAKGKSKKLAPFWKKVTVKWYGNIFKEVSFLEGTHLWYSPGSGVVLIKWVLVKTGKGEFFPLLSSDINFETKKIIELYVMRFSIEITFEESRAHLGVETQRQWSKLSITRSTPLLMALYSLVCLVAHSLQKEEEFLPKNTAWYNSTIKFLNLQS